MARPLAGFSTTMRRAGTLRARIIAAVVFVLLGSVPERARAQELGEAGESCTKRNDCLSGLRCIEQRCVTAPACTSHSDCGVDSSCTDGVCTTTPSADPGSDEKAPQSDEWDEFVLTGAHPFLGLAVGPAVGGWWLFRQEQLDINPAFFFGFRGGAYFGRAELAFELAPVTWLPDFDGDPNLSFLVSIGGLPKLGDNVYWPLRFGLGLSALNLPDDQVFMQARLDLLGVAFQYGHLLFEVSLPSTRFHTDFDVHGVWGWVCAVSVSYVL